MGRRLFIGPLMAWLVLGVALFATRAVVDQAVTANGLLRFALIPSLTELLGWLAIAAPLVAGISRRHTVLPLFGLIVLLIPFLPWVADRWPFTQIFAGPFSAIVWLSVATVQAWVLGQSRVISWPWRLRWNARGAVIAIWIATVAIAGSAAWRLTGTNLFPGGDEPHYLVIAQSLWRDGDLKIENNHARGDYKEYFEANLEPHYHTRGVDGAIYSIHPIGMPVLMAPVYAAGGYRAVVLGLILIAATAAALAWWWTARALASTSAATFAWIAIACSAPFLFNTFTVYPEMVAALAVMIALVLAATTRTIARSVAIGLACGALPWLSTKYAPMSAALVLVALSRVSARDQGSDPSESAALKFAGVGVPYALSLLGWFTFFYVYWGSPMPSAPYGADSQTSALNTLIGVPGLLLDQEYGLLAYAPVFILAGTGLVTMWLAGGDLRRRAIELGFVFSALIVTVGAFDIWWGGSAAPARPIASGLLLLSLPIAISFRNTPAGSLGRAGQFLLLAIGIGITATLAVAQGGSLIDNGRDGSSALLEYWSPRWPMWKLAPSFITRDSPGVDLTARSRLTSLDTFDADARPTGIVYDPFRFVKAEELLSYLSLSVRPRQRADPQPLRVIHNGRFALPAGTFDLAVEFGDQVPSQATPLALQVGRMGPPFQSWMLQPKPGDQWHASITLAADVAFVGLRGALDMERAITRITFTPTAIVNAGARPRIPEVLAAAKYGDITIFFHRLELTPEPAGFWTIGRRDGRITVAAGPGRAMPLLRVHSGSAPNRARFSSGGWEQRLDMVPGRHYDVALPAGDTGVSTIDIATDSGFSPQQLDPASNDARFLGIWIEVISRI